MCFDYFDLKRILCDPKQNNNNNYTYKGSTLVSGISGSLKLTAWEQRKYNNDRNLGKLTLSIN